MSLASLLKEAADYCSAAPGERPAQVVGSVPRGIDTGGGDSGGIGDSSNQLGRNYVVSGDDVVLTQQRGFASVAELTAPFPGMDPGQLFGLLTRQDLPPIRRNVKERLRHDLLHASPCGRTRTYASEMVVDLGLPGFGGSAAMAFTITTETAERSSDGGTITMSLARGFGLVKRLECVFEVGPMLAPPPHCTAAADGPAATAATAGPAAAARSPPASDSGAATPGGSSANTSSSSSADGWEHVAGGGDGESPPAPPDAPMLASAVRIVQKVAPALPSFDPLSKRIIRGINKRQVLETAEDIAVHVQAFAQCHT